MMGRPVGRDAMENIMQISRPTAAIEFAER